MTNMRIFAKYVIIIQTNKYVIIIQKDIKYACFHWMCELSITQIMTNVYIFPEYVIPI